MPSGSFRNVWVDTSKLLTLKVQWPDSEPFKPKEKLDAKVYIYNPSAPNRVAKWRILSSLGSQLVVYTGKGQRALSQDGGGGLTSHTHTCIQATHARKTQHKQAIASDFPCSATIIWCLKTALCWCENLTTSLSICTRLAWCRGSWLSVQLRPKQVCKWNKLLSQTLADRSVGPMTMQTLYYDPLHSWSAGRLQTEVRLEDTGTQPTAK